MTTSSSHTSHPRIACVLYWTFGLPTLSWACIFVCLLHLFQINNLTLVLSISNWPAFSYTPLCPSLVHLLSLWMHSAMPSSSTAHTTSSTKDMPSFPYSSSLFSTCLNNPQRYINRRTGDTGDPSRTPISMSILWSLFPFIDKITFLSSMRLSTHPTRSALRPILCILFVKFPFATCEMAPLMSINNTAIVFPLSHISFTLIMNLSTTSTAKLVFLYWTYALWSSRSGLRSYANAFAATVSTTIHRQFNNVATLYALATT